MMMRIELEAQHNTHPRVKDMRHALEQISKVNKVEMTSRSFVLSFYRAELLILFVVQD